MKKFLFLLIAMLSVTFVFAESKSSGNVITNSVDSVYHDGKDAVTTIYNDGKEVVSTVYNDTKDVLKDVYPNIRSTIASIGRAIGVAAEHVYTVLVKKYIVIGIKELLKAIVAFALLLFGYIKWNKVTKEEMKYTCILPIAMMLVGLITLAKVNYDDMLMGLINPEYGAINYIMEQTKEIIK